MWIVPRQALLDACMTSSLQKLGEANEKPQDAESQNCIVLDRESAYVSTMYRSLQLVSEMLPILGSLPQDEQCEQ
jgi:hypothetical protein